MTARRRVLCATALATLAFVVLGAPAATAGTAPPPFQWPVDPVVVVNPFDPPEVSWGSGHRGVDLAASVGQEIRAPASGSVTFAGVIAGRGVVVVSHGAVRTTYEPVDNDVTVGMSVVAGDVLGTLQSFAHHCMSPCLHWGARRGDEYLDPTSFVNPGPSRLLPVWDDSAARHVAEGGAASGVADSVEMVGVAGYSGASGVAGYSGASGVAGASAGQRLNPAGNQTPGDAVRSAPGPPAAGATSVEVASAAALGAGGDTKPERPATWAGHLDVAVASIAAALLAAVALGVARERR